MYKKVTEDQVTIVFSSVTPPDSLQQARFLWNMIYQIGLITIVVWFGVGLVYL